MTSIRKYCDNSRRLIEELKNSKETIIPKYNERLIKGIQQDQEDLKVEIEKLNKVVNNSDSSEDSEDDSEKVGDGKESLFTTFKVLIGLYSRNKRCLICYCFERLKRIKEVFWEHNGFIPPSIVSRMSSPEINYFQEYHQDINNFSEKIDLLSCCDPIISELYVTVEVLSDLGNVQTLEGNYLFKKNTIIRMKKTEAKDFILKNQVRVVDHTL